MQLPNKDYLYTKLGFLDMQLTSASVAHCKQCFDDNKTCIECTCTCFFVKLDKEEFLTATHFSLQKSYDVVTLIPKTIYLTQ